MPARRRPAAQSRPRIDFQRLQNAAALTQVTHDFQIAPAQLEALVSLDRWSLAIFDGGVHLLGVTDWGEVVSLDVDALAKDRSWVRRTDGTYLRLLEPWALPCVRGDRA